MKLTWFEILIIMDFVSFIIVFFFYWGSNCDIIFLGDFMRKSYLTKIYVKDAMINKFMVVPPDMTIEELNDIIILKKWEEVIVVDENSVIGIVTKNDLARNLASGIGKDVKVKYIMSPNVITIEPNKDLIEARSEMRRFGIGRAPVLNNNGDIIGLLTVKSTCDGFSGKLNDVVDFLQNILENIDDAIIITDLDGQVEYWNSKAEKLFVLDLSYIDKEIKINDILLENNIKDIKQGQIFNINDKDYIVKKTSIKNGNKYKNMYLFKDVTEAVRLSLELQKTNIQYEYLKKKVDKDDYKCFGKFKSKNDKMQSMINIAKRVALTDATILIQGETGTGKELLADGIYEYSQRSNKPFIKVNCGAIPENLFESELFGYEPGAFTGASKYGKIGMFQMADGGTIFLDEVEELPFLMQPKILRVLQDHTFYRVGGTKPVKVDIRIITATNKDLKEMVRNKKFREDLYYRLNVIQLNLLPLRKRREDILLLANQFIKEFCEKYNKKIMKIDNEVLKFMIDYDWPGNVRELKNIIERMVILSEDGIIRRDIIINDKHMSKDNDEYNELDKLEKEKIIETLKIYKDNKSKVAKHLRIPRSTLYYKLKKYGILIK